MPGNATARVAPPALAALTAGADKSVRPPQHGQIRATCRFVAEATFQLHHGSRIVLRHVRKRYRLWLVASRKYPYDKKRRNIPTAFSRVGRIHSGAPEPFELRSNIVRGGRFRQYPRISSNGRDQKTISVETDSTPRIHPRVPRASDELPVHIGRIARPLWHTYITSTGSLLSLEAQPPRARIFWLANTCWKTIKGRSSRPNPKLISTPLVRVEIASPPPASARSRGGGTGGI